MRRDNQQTYESSDSPVELIHVQRVFTYHSTLIFTLTMQSSALFNCKGLSNIHILYHSIVSERCVHIDPFKISRASSMFETVAYIYRFITMYFSLKH